MRPPPGAPTRSPHPTEETLWTLPRLLHELRGPLQALTDGVGRLALRVRGRHNRGLTGRLHAVAERLAGILSTAEGGSGVRAVSPAAVVETVVAEARVGHADRVVEVRCAAATRGETLLDAVALAQAVSNLVGNALLHAAGSAVRVTLARPAVGAARLILTVEDDGPGLGLGERRRAFSEGWRGRASAGAHPGGKGLGLAVVHRLAQSAGGGIALGASPSGGCRFDLTLPIHQAPQAARGGMRVAVIDDDPACREAMRRLLIRLGATAWVESSRPGLRRRLERSEADLLILDRRWSGDADAGSRLARRLRLENWPGGLVLWSGAPGRPSATFDAAVGKPAARHELEQALEEARQAAEGRRRLRRSLARRWATDLARLKASRGSAELSDRAHHWAGALGLAGWGALAEQARALELACAAGDARDIARRRRTLIGGLRARQVRPE